MIKVDCSKDEIIFSGHSIPEICAAVSSVMYTSVNILLRYDENCYDYCDNFDEDYVRISIKHHDYIVDMVIENMIEMLEDIVDDNNEDKLEVVRS